MYIGSTHLIFGGQGSAIQSILLIEYHAIYIYIYIYTRIYIYIYFFWHIGTFVAAVSRMNSAFLWWGIASSSIIRPNGGAKSARYHSTAPIQKSLVHGHLFTRWVFFEPFAKSSCQSAIHRRWVLFKRRCTPSSFGIPANCAALWQLGSHLMVSQHCAQPGQVQCEQSGGFWRMCPEQPLREVDELHASPLCQQPHQGKPPNWRFL